MAASLRRCLDVQWDATALALQNLSSGLSASGVWRVRQREAGSFSFILKIPDWQDSPVLRLFSEDVIERERRVFESGLLEKLMDSGILTPRILAVETYQEHIWIWMEDLDGALLPIRTRDDAQVIARECSRLHRFYQQHREELERFAWLSRNEHRRYAHLAPLAEHNLTLLPAQSAPQLRFSSQDIDDLKDALKSLDWIDSEIAGLPSTLSHGDFHNRNLGLSNKGAMIVLDWAHLGIGPPGCDMATFISLYRLFGGMGGDYGSGFDEQMIDAYAGSLQETGTRAISADQVWRACGLWHLSWGLHLRLGAGLQAIFENRILEEEGRERAAMDVREGCQRALDFFRKNRSLSSFRREF